MAQKISRALAGQMIREVNDGQFFSVTFIKRSDKTIREMNCRKGVKKNLAGGTLAYNPSIKSLVSVFDVKADGYRMIPLEGVMSIRMAGNVFEVEGD